MDNPDCAACGHAESEHWEEAGAACVVPRLCAGFDPRGRRVAARMRSIALSDVIVERTRQDAKWGEQNHDPFAYLAILMEEVGEMAQAAVQARMEGGDPKRIREEAVQTAAVALAIVECLDRGKWKWPRE